MDFQLKQWRQQQQQHESEQEQHQHQPPSAKQPRLLLGINPQQEQHQHNPSEASALPLFVPENSSNRLSNLSAYSPDSTAVTAATPKYPRMGSYFSLVQWQELELQALIFRHMLAGAPIPHELLQLVKKSLISSPSYYLPHPVQHFPYYQQSLLQSGYWGRGGMDPEPGRCRRTDGKKWRCSRDVVAGHKYCERHVHRGRNRSRKPVEIPTTGGGDAGGGILKTNHPLAAQPLAAAMAGGGGTSHFSLAEPSPSIDLLHLSQRPTQPLIAEKDPLQTQNDASSADGGKPSGQILRHFLDDWPRSLQQNENVGSN